MEKFNILLGSGANKPIVKYYMHSLFWDALSPSEKMDSNRVVWKFKWDNIGDHLAQCFHRGSA